MSETFLIDRIPAIKLFSDMLEGKSNNRILRIVGAGKMGKSRLLREYRKLTLEKKAGDCALIDLRSKFQNYGDIVFQITQQVPVVEFTNFSNVQQQLSSAPKVEVTRSNLLFSTMSVNMPDQRDDSADEYARQKITSAFCKDISSAKLGHPTVLLFDTFDGASVNIQNWLNEQILVALFQMPNIYIVVAGRELPDLPDILLENSETYELSPVSLDDHMSYCSSLGLNVSQEVIEAFHDAFDGIPGLFSEYASKLKGKESL